MANLISIALEARNATGPAIEQARKDLKTLNGDIRNLQAPRLNADALRGDVQSIGRALTGAKADAEGASLSLNALRDAASGALSGLGGIGSALAPIAAAAGPVTILATALVGLAAASVTVATGLSKDVQAIENLSRRTGIAVDDVQALQRSLKNAGASPDAFIRPLERLNRELAENSDLVKQLGLSGLAPLDALRKLLGILSSSPDVVKRNEVANRLLGQSYGELAGVTDALGAGFDRAKARGEALGLTFDKDLREGAAEFRVELSDLTDQWAALWTSIQRQTVGPANQIVKAFNDIAEAARTGVGPVGDLVGLFRSLNDLSKAPAKFVFDQLFPPAAEVERVSDAMSGALDKLGEFRPKALVSNAGADPLATINLVPTKESPREKQIQSIKDLIGSTRVEAVALVDQLDAISRDARLTSIAESIRKATGNLPQNILDALSPGAQQSLLEKYVLGPKELPPVSEQVRAQLGLIKAQFDTLEAILPTGTGLGVASALLPPPEAVRARAAELSSIARAGAQGIVSGFETAFLRLRSSTQTIMGAVKSIFLSVIDSILQAIGRLVATGLLNLIGSAFGFPGLGTITTGIGGGGNSARSVSPDNGELGPGVAGGSSATNVYINAMDARSFFGELVSPFGSRNQSRVRELELAASV